jgi:hypothetical protein
MYRRKCQKWGYSVEADYWVAGTQKSVTDLETEIRYMLLKDNDLPWDQKVIGRGKNDNYGLPWEKKGGDTPFEEE